MFEVEPLERLTTSCATAAADDAAPYEARLAELSPPARTARIA